jgi:predicted O-methyltransferase YrrM
VGEEYHDPELFDAVAGQMDSFRAFRRTLALAELEDTVVPIVAASSLAGRRWATPLQLVFIDGGHSQAAAMADFEAWSPHVAIGGYLAIHDIFPNPNDGGQAPYEIYRLALTSGRFVECDMTKTLGVLQRR